METPTQPGPEEPGKTTSNKSQASISADEARAALQQADAEEHATLNRPMPGWYLAALAIILFAIFALNAIDGATAWMRVVQVVALILLAVAIGALVGAVSFTHPGYRNVHIKWLPAVLWGVVAAAFPVCAMILAPLIGSWIWLVSGALLSLLIVVVGTIYRRRLAHGKQ